MANCIYETFYCTDNPIVVGSVLFLNNTSPYQFVPEGFYATEVGTGLGLIYETNRSSEVINIYTPDNSICSNNVPPPPPPPPITYTYYNVGIYSCLPQSFCDFVDFGVVSADDTYPLTINKFYRPIGGIATTFSYQIIDNRGINIGLIPIVDPTPYDTCQLACT
jgi:hypothetical protein